MNNKADSADADSDYLTLSQAVKIAKTSSECTALGIIANDAIFNENTDTWWIELEQGKEGCNPACVVSTITKDAVVNWRCTGLIE